MSELSIVLVFLTAISGGSIFICYMQLGKSLNESFELVMKLYERNDLWQSKASPGSQKVR
jgi:hypothetical protein